MIIRKVFNTAVLWICVSCLFCRCAPLGPSCISKAPEWATNPRSDSPNYLYQVGVGTSKISYEDAEAKAFDNALAMLARRIMSNVEVQSEHVIVSTSQTLYGTEVVPEGRFTCYDDAYRVWLLVRYPRQNYEQEIRNRIRPAKLLAAAEKLLQVKDPLSQKSGRDSMATILAEYPIGLQHYFESEYVAMRLADIEISSNNPCAAQHLLSQVVNHSKADRWRDRASTMLARVKCSQSELEDYKILRNFAGTSVALICCYRIDKSNLVEFKDLYSEIASTFTSLGVRVTPAKMSPLLSGEGADAIANSIYGYDFVVVLVAELQQLERSKTTLVGDLSSVVLGKNGYLLRDSFPVGCESKVGPESCLYALSKKAASTWKSRLSNALE